MPKAAILIVEDEGIIAADLDRKLRRLGYEIIGITARGEEAVNLARQLRPNLVLMDIRLKGSMDGIEAAEVIRREFDLPVIYLTAHSDSTTLQRAMLTEAFGYVLKPVAERELETHIEMALYRHQAERKLRESEERFRTIFEEGPLAMVLITEDGRLLRSNRAFCRLLGYTEADQASQVFADFMHPADLEVFSAGVKQLVNGEAASFHQEKRYLCKGGSLIWGDTSTAAVRDGHGSLLHFVVHIHDITERKRAEEELRSSREQLRNLAARLQVVREEERTNIAREIHDVLAQELSCLKMSVTSLTHLLAKPQDSSRQNQVAKKLANMEIATDSAFESVQKIATGLRPAVLDILGLCAAIEWQAREFQSRTGILCHPTLPDGGLAVEKDHSTALFRILQESLTNAARHASASRVEVILGSDMTSISLIVRDNGRGIQANQATASGSFGLLGMRERAMLLGGQCEITGVPGKGTTVRAWLPLPPK